MKAFLSRCRLLNLNVVNIHLNSEHLANSGKFRLDKLSTFERVQKTRFTRSAVANNHQFAINNLQLASLRHRIIIIISSQQNNGKTQKHK